MRLYGPLWVLIGLDASVRVNMGPYESVWFLINLYAFL